MRSYKSCIKSVAIGFCFLALIHGICPQEKQGAGSGKSGEGTVLVRVNVTDKLNRFVTGLEGADFRIYQNGAPRPITYFVKNTSPLSLAVASNFTPNMENRQKKLDSALQRMIESARPEDEFFILSYNFSRGSVESMRRQGQTMDQYPSIGPIPGLTSLEQVIMGGIEKLKKKTQKTGLLAVTWASDLQISRAYDLLSKVGNLSDVRELQFYTIAQEGGSLPSSSSKDPGIVNQKSYTVNDVDEIGYYLDLVYSDLRSQYILGYASTRSIFTLQNLKVKVEVERRGLPDLTVRVGKPYYAQLP